MSTLEPVEFLSLVIPARNEEGCLEETLTALHQRLKKASIKHEIIVVDDGSTDRTWEILSQVKASIPELVPIHNGNLNGFGRAIHWGLNHMRGDAVIIYMADASDDPEDVVRYFQVLNEGVDCVFGSRFMRGGKTVDYPKVKWVLNRFANGFIRMLFTHGLNDTTNAFKAYRRTVIEGCRPILSPHFNITVELPLKAIIRGYSFRVLPITWTNRKTGTSKLKIREMGSRYFFIVMYVWLENFFSRGDYHRDTHEGEQTSPGVSNSRQTPEAK